LGNGSPQRARAGKIGFLIPALATKVAGLGGLLKRIFFDILPGEKQYLSDLVLYKERSR
jgi:hypothetical protein